MILFCSCLVKVRHDDKYLFIVWLRTGIIFWPQAAKGNHVERGIPVQLCLYFFFFFHIFAFCSFPSLSLSLSVFLVTCSASKLGVHLLVSIISVMPLDSLLTTAFYGWVSVAPLLLRPCRLKWSLSLSNNQLPCFLSLCLSIAPSLQSFYSCFAFPRYLVRQGCNEWHFSPVALGNWDWQPGCLLVSSAGWFKNATRYTFVHTCTHTFMVSIHRDSTHFICFCLCLYRCNHCTTILLLALFPCFIFIFAQSKHILYVDWERLEKKMNGKWKRKFGLICISSKVFSEEKYLSFDLTSYV